MKKETKEALKRYVDAMLDIHEKFAKNLTMLFNKKYPMEQIDFKENGGKLLVASAIATDKLWRMSMEHRKSPLYQKYNSNTQDLITTTTFWEVLLAIGIVKKTQDRVNKIYQEMCKYPEAFKVELKFYKKTNGEVQMNPHKFDDYKGD